MLRDYISIIVYANYLCYRAETEKGLSRKHIVEGKTRKDRIRYVHTI